MNPQLADDRLHALAIACLTLAYQNPRAPQAQRTTEMPVGDIRLQALGLYADDVEDALLIRSTATAEKSVYDNDLIPRVVFRCFWQGHEVRLTREAALQVLIDEALALDVQSGLRAKAADAAAFVAAHRDDAAYFDALNRPQPSTYDDGGRSYGGARKTTGTKLLPPMGHDEAQAWMRRFY